MIDYNLILYIAKKISYYIFLSDEKDKKVINNQHSINSRMINL